MGPIREASPRLLYAAQPGIVTKIAAVSLFASFIAVIAVGSEEKDELVVAEMNLDVIEEVRRIWQFYRDRRPETYGDMVKQLP